MDSSSDSEKQRVSPGTAYQLLVQRRRAKVALAFEQCKQASDELYASCSQPKKLRVPVKRLKPIPATRNSERIAGQKEVRYQEEPFQQLYRRVKNKLSRMSVPGSNTKSAKTPAPAKSRQPEEAMPLKDLIRTVPAGQQIEDDVLDHIVEALQEAR